MTVIERFFMTVQNAESRLRGCIFFYFPPWTANLWGSTVQCRYNRMLFLKFDVQCGGNNAEGAISNQAGETLAATD